MGFFFGVGGSDVLGDGRGGEKKKVKIPQKHKSVIKSELRSNYCCFISPSEVTCPSVSVCSLE